MCLFSICVNDEPGKVVLIKHKLKETQNMYRIYISSPAFSPPYSIVVNMAKTKNTCLPDTNNTDDYKREKDLRIEGERERTTEAR